MEATPTPRLICGDCIEGMRSLEDSSVDLVATDPPYFFVKAEEWDRQWASPEAFLDWIGTCADEWRRILKPNGSLYVFASSEMAGRVEGVIRERFEVLNHIVWVKANAAGYGPWNRAHKEDLRSFFPQTERIIFAEQLGADETAKGEAGYEAKCAELKGFVFEPIRKYLADEWFGAGLTKRDAEEATDTQMASHWFSRSQWAFPTREHYLTLQQRANRKGPFLEKRYPQLRAEYDHLLKDYGHLCREYEELKKEFEALRRPFSVTSEVPYTDAWSFPTVDAYDGKHPCEKPLELMEHIVEASSTPGSVVLDCFMGSGSTGLAALRCGRDFIGIERDPAWLAVASERLQAPRFPRRRPVRRERPMPLFE